MGRAAATELLSIALRHAGQPLSQKKSEIQGILVGARTLRIGDKLQVQGHTNGSAASVVEAPGCSDVDSGVSCKAIWVTLCLLKTSRQYYIRCLEPAQAAAR